MLAKKSPKAQLGAYSKIFFQLGLSLSLVIIYIAIEWKSFDRSISELSAMDIQDEEIIDIPITERILEVKPPPPPPPAPEVIEIVADEQEIEETILESTETDESEGIIVEVVSDIIAVEEEEVIIEDVPFVIIEEVPIFPGCSGTRQELRKCFSNEISKFVLKEFNADLATDLGMTSGSIQKIFVTFKIDKNGNVVNIMARAPHKKLQVEAIRVIELLPKMSPGKQRGKPVGVKYGLPIVFKVE